MSQKISNKIKICISATGNNLDAALDPRFGRAMYFLIIDAQGKLIKAIKNTGAQVTRGAGVRAAQIVANEKVGAIITGNIGPNAFIVLQGSKIKILIAQPGMTAQQTFENYQKNELQEASQAMPCHPVFMGSRKSGKGPGQCRGFARGPKR